LGSGSKEKNREKKGKTSLPKKGGREMFIAEIEKVLGEENPFRAF